MVAGAGPGAAAAAAAVPAGGGLLRVNGSGTSSGNFKTDSEVRSSTESRYTSVTVTVPARRCNFKLNPHPLV